MTLEPLPVSKGSAGELESDLQQGMEGEDTEWLPTATGQGYWEGVVSWECGKALGEGA